MLKPRRFIFGELKDCDSPLTREEIVAICEQAGQKAGAFARYPVDKVLRLLGRLQKLWQNPDYEPRKAAAATLPEATGFSPQMIELALNEMPNLFDPQKLQKKLEVELQGLKRNGEYSWEPLTRSSKAIEPLGTVLHVLSGNVFLVAAGALIQGLITGNLSIFKMSSDERLFLPALLESLKSVDEDGVVSSSLVAIDYTSDRADLIDALKTRMDGIVVWGGESAVAGYRNNLPAKTRLIVFGPRISMAIVTEKALASDSCAKLAEGLAFDMSIWDQNACTAPQVCFVEGKESANLLAAAMKEPLQKLCHTLPPGKPGFEESVEIRKMRTVAEIAEARGSGLLIGSEKNLAYTVIVDADQTIEPSPLSRTLRIIPYKTIDEVYVAMRPLRGYLQTVGLAAASVERPKIVENCVAVGALRICEPGKMAASEIDDPHDGEYDLPKFFNTIIDRPASQACSYFPLDFAPEEQRREVINARLRKLIDFARQAPFYRERLQGISIDTVEDLVKLPILTREMLENNAPPFSDDMLTHAATGGYVARSGGSTGEPRYSYYDGHDWEMMIDNAVRLFRAMGLQKGDRLANCFLAGDLYGSFVSFDHINVRTGVTNFAFAGNVRPDVLARVWKQFNLNAIMGVPATIMPVLREARKIEPQFSLEKVIYAGMPLSQTDRSWLESELKVTNISSVIGANDGGQIGFQCQAMQGAWHHAIDDFNYIEIVDEHGNPVEEGVKGRILITSLLKYAVPLIRYEIGDAGCFSTRPCDCGRTMRVFEYLGRIDDQFTIGLINVELKDFRAAWAGFPITEIQLIARFDDNHREYLQINVESTQVIKPEQLDAAALEKMPKLASSIAENKLKPLQINICEAGTLTRNPRTGKVKAIIDER